MSPSTESFNGPWCKTLDDLHTSIKRMPAKYKATFDQLSTDTLAAVCNTAHLHVWETDSDIDNLLQLTQTIVKIRTTAGTARAESATGKNAGPGMLIITEVKEKEGRDNFARICALVKHLTISEGRSHLDGKVRAFSGIVVVRGVDNRHIPVATKGGQLAYTDEARIQMDSAVRRIDVAIERVFQLDIFSSSFNRKIVWHHGPVIHFLLHWINTTTSSLRSSLTGITIQSALSFTFTTGVQPSPLGRLNTLSQLATLEEYTKNLNISAVFLDTSAQLITFEYLATYMYFFGYYINTFLPVSISRIHLHRAQDQLVRFAFRLWGACQSKYGADVVKAVQSALDHSKARAWANLCIQPNSYTKEACQAAAKDSEIHHAVQLADSPFSLFTHTASGLPAFSRLMIGPGQPTPTQYSIAAPFTISFSGPNMASYRAASPSTLRLLLPNPHLPTTPSLTPTNTTPSDPKQRLETITARIQGTMMGVLERVRQDKGMPDLADDERDMWKEVIKACEGALEGCRGRLPKGVDEKVRFVRQKLEGGTWGYALGAGMTQRQGQGWGSGVVVGAGGVKGGWGL